RKNASDNTDASKQDGDFENVGYSADDNSAEENKEKKVYHYPPVQLLKLPKNPNDKNAMEEMQRNATKLIKTLDSFGVKASIVNICRGPSVTRYELQPAPGVKISKITNLSDDIALNLAANGVRIEAPIPGKAAVGIEVPNKVVSSVSMRELIDSDKFKNAKSKLTTVLGRDISGEIVITDLAKMPHLLIAGTTGSGKSVCVNSILMSILYKATPDEVKLLLIDPKMVEFSKYKGVPHLLVPVVSDAKKAAGALGWAVNEMLNRYKIFSEFDCKDIDSYNVLVEKNIKYMAENPPVEDENGELKPAVMEANGLPVAKEKMPRVVIAIDELADLMMAAPSEVEDSICRLAQMARAAGMHLILATQRPTVNVITGLIKANVPSRISLKVSSNTDSRTILDVGGGEKLIGRGDMLFAPVGAPKPIRVQGCYASDEEIEGVTSYIKKSYSAQYNADIEETIKRIAAEEIATGKKPSEADGDDGGLDVDSKMEEAIKCVIDAGQASTSLIQRRLKVGYARAGRMIDDMEQIGIVGPHQGSKPRDVLMTYNEWLERRNVLQNRED
ncbi:MAG: DNA translocase FtsK, partial [Clostridiales bacterium]|nr:DNA translocase FtsK [Clostridiales bacterium]